MDPKYIISNSHSVPWQKDKFTDGVDVKPLGAANGYSMELYRFAPNTSYPDHFHEGPEFVYLVEGQARQYGQWLEPGWASIGETGTLDDNFISGDAGCIFLCVHTASRYVHQ